MSRRASSNSAGVYSGEVAVRAAPRPGSSARVSDRYVAGSSGSASARRRRRRRRRVVEREHDRRSTGDGHDASGAARCQNAVERAVVDGDVLGPAHERRPAGPVHARSAAEPDRGRAPRRKSIGRCRPAPSSPRRAAPARTRPRAAPAPPRGRRDRGSRSSGTARQRGLHDRRRARAARTRSWSSRYLRIVPSVTSTDALVERGRVRARRAPAPSRSSRRRPAACRARARAAPRPPPRPARASASDTSGARDAHDRELALEVGVLDPVVEAAALQRVVHVAGAVRREHHDRRHVGAERARARGP